MQKMKVVVAHSDRRHLKSAYDFDSEGRDSLQDVNDVANAIIEIGHDVTLLAIDENCFDALREIKPDVIFNVCDDGIHNNARMEPHVTTIFEILRIPYTGANYFALGLGQDKARTKMLLAFNGIPTAKFQLFPTTDEQLNPGLRFPLIVKPNFEDGSIGIKNDSVVHDELQLKNAVAKIIKTYRQPALVEEFIDGREFNVSILGNGKKLVLPPSEIIYDNFPANTPKILTYDAKWLEESDVFKKTYSKCPTVIDAKLEQQMKKIAAETYDLVACRGYGRIDFRLDNEGIPHVLEINPNPDISKTAGFAKTCHAAGIPYINMIEKILSYAFES